MIDDPELPKTRKTWRTYLCSGRIYVDLVTSDLRKDNPDDAIVRVEQLYPFPRQAIEEIVESYPHLQSVIWVQEEPLNMGAWEICTLACENC